MYKAPWWLCCFLMVLFPVLLHGQYFSTGEDPAQLRWRQITTENFQLIYPDHFEERAQAMAHYFERVYLDLGSTLAHSPRPVSIIFHTQTVRSNGLVGWAPRRMEIFTPPHQEIYPQDWLEQLAIHEFRHVVQLDKIHTQMPAILRVVFGEQISALITGIYIPFWFLEGDAVVAETAFSRYGRGRLPAFLMEHRAQLVEKGAFSFDKAFNGSFRHFVPNHYKLGYHLVGESRARYGSELWASVFDRVSRRPYSLVPVNKVMRQTTGKNQIQLYKSIFDSLQTAWRIEDAKQPFTPFSEVTLPAAQYANYRFNHILPNGHIVSLKSSFDLVDRFVEINEQGEEKVLHVPGIIFDESVGYRNEWLVWSEYIPDMRWSHAGRSKINLFHYSRGLVGSFYTDYKGFAPSISPDEQYVSILEVDDSNHYYLSIYMREGGELVKRFQTPNSEYLFSPVWIDMETIAFVALTDNGKRLATINFQNGSYEQLFDQEMGEIKQLFANNDRLWFISGHTGRDELWSLRKGDDFPKLMVASRFGLAYPAISENAEVTIVSNYTSDGYRVVNIDPEEFENKLLTVVSSAIYPLAEVMAGQEGGVIRFEEVAVSPWPSAPYLKAHHLFKVHSWGPLVIDASSYDIQPGFSLLSQNMLGTNEASMGYRWDRTEKVGTYFAKMEYKGWYPKLSAEINYGRRNGRYYEITQYVNPQGEITRRDTVLKRFDWDQPRFILQGHLPMSLTSGRYFRLLQPELRFDLTGYRHLKDTPENFFSGTMQNLQYRLYYHQLMRRAYRDLQSRWGLVADMSFRHSVNTDNGAGNMLAGQLRGYLPGGLPSHGITLYGAHQQRQRGANHSFSDAVRIPRGWLTMNSRELTSLSAEYRLPIFYPDLNIGKYFYARRVKAAFFADYALYIGDYLQNGEITGSFEKSISTLGIEVTADSNFMRLYAPASIGFRTNYLMGVNRVNFEFLFSIDFSSF